MIQSRNSLFKTLLFVLPATAAGPLGCAADVRNGDRQGRESTSATKQALAPGSFAGFVLAPNSATLMTNGTEAVLSDRSYNSQGGTNTVRWIATGQYEVDFPGLDTLGDVQVTSFGSNNERCKVKNWFGSEGMLQVFVNCFDFWGNFTDSLFTAHFFERSDRVPGSEAEQGAYVWVNQPDSTYNPNTSWQWTSNGSGITVTHNGAGDYKVSFGINITNNGGIVEVTGYGEQNSDGTTNNGFCKVKSWGGSVVNVLCFDGTTHQLRDSKFDLVFSNASPNNINSYNWSWVEGSLLTAPSGWNSGLIYAGLDGNNYPYGSTPGLVSLTRSPYTQRDVGAYYVRYPGMATSSARPLSVNVTSYGSGSDTCQVSGWDQRGSDGFAEVLCYDENNNPADEDFTTTYNSLAFVIP